MAIALGSVHGRFQPFHNGHLDYVAQAFEQCDFLLVGLTQIYRPAAEAAGHRDSESANPLTYYERSILVDAALQEFGLKQRRFLVTPFPIEMPARLPEFVPLGATCFTTLVTPWNNEKIERLEQVGYQTATLRTSLPDNNRVTSGTQIREMMRASDRRWTRFVPPVVAELINERFMDRFGC